MFTAGYAWLVYIFKTIEENAAFEGCFIKQISGIPCPSCGTTRSIISLLRGDFCYAFLLNPLGYLVALIMLVFPPWLIVDLVTKQKTVYTFYYKVESMLKKPPIAIPIFFLIIVNWIWNITKGL